MSKWRDNFEVSNSVKMLKDAVREAKSENYKAKINKALSDTIKGKYARKGGKK